MQDFLERVEYFGAVADRFAKAWCTDWDDHEFLDVQVIVGMRAAVNDVHHWHRHLHGAGTAEITIQRQAGFFRCGLGNGHRYRQHGVGAEAAFVFGAVKVDQSTVEESLFVGIEAHDGFGNFSVDMLASFQHAFAEITALVAIAQFDCFTRTGRRTGGHGRAAHDAGFQQDIALNGWIAA